MTALDYKLDKSLGSRATFGLVVLQTDETIEVEFRHLIDAKDLALYVTRIASGATVTPGSLAAMEDALPVAAGLFPPSLEFDAIGYACTSGATVIGPAKIASLVRSAARVEHVTDPLTAVMAACEVLKVTRLGFVTPYLPQVSAAMRQALEARGLEIAAFGSFEQAEEEKVVRISRASILDAAIKVGEEPACEAVFLSCTNLRALDIIAKAEAVLGKPVITSNQALAWHMLRLVGIPVSAPAYGKLMRTQ